MKCTYVPSLSVHTHPLSRLYCVQSKHTIKYINSVATNILEQGNNKRQNWKLVKVTSLCLKSAPTIKLNDSQK